MTSIIPRDDGGGHVRPATSTWVARGLHASLLPVTPLHNQPVDAADPAYFDRHSTDSVNGSPDLCPWSDSVLFVPCARTNPRDASGPMCLLIGRSRSHGVPSDVPTRGLVSVIVAGRKMRPSIAQ